MGSVRGQTKEARGTHSGKRSVPGRVDSYDTMVVRIAADESGVEECVCTGRLSTRPGESVHGVEEWVATTGTENVKKGG
jgi:hypothetical protein